MLRIDVALEIGPQWCEFKISIELAQCFEKDFGFELGADTEV